MNWTRIWWGIAISLLAILLYTLWAVRVHAGEDPCQVGSVEVTLYGQPPIRVGREAQLHASLYGRDKNKVSARCPISVAWVLGQSGAECRLADSGPLDPTILCSSPGRAIVFARAQGVEGVGVFEVVR